MSVLFPCRRALKTKAYRLIKLQKHRPELLEHTPPRVICDEVVDSTVRQQSWCMDARHAHDWVNGAGALSSDMFRGWRMEC